MISIERILCPVDFSETSRRALAYAAALARHYDARVTVLHAFAAQPVVTLPAGGLDGAPAVWIEPPNRDAAVAATRRLAEEAGGKGRLDVEVQDAPNAATEIVAQAHARNADLIVMGSHGRTGLGRLVLGSVADKVLRHARPPVLIVPPHAGEGTAPAPAVPIRRVVCPIDFSDSSIRALEYAFRLVEETDGTLTLLHVMEVPPEIPDAVDVRTEQQRAADRAEFLRRLRAAVPADARAYCTIDTRVEDGTAWKEIVKVAGEQQANLIVMGVHGRSVVDQLMFGSTTHSVLHHATCPVLTVRA